jgi:hypothetical protein
MNEELGPDREYFSNGSRLARPAAPRQGLREEPLDLVAVGRSADAKDKHCESENSKYQLNVLAVNLAGEDGELSECVFHCEFPFG